MSETLDSITYAAGFAEGERQAWEDRQTGRHRDMPVRDGNPYRCGLVDGYTPRSPWWGLPTRRGRGFMVPEFA